MPDRNASLRWLSMLLSCALALAWVACESTETGNPPALPNPPRVNLDRFDLQLSDEGLLVIGAPGSVVPGGSTVEVTEQISGAKASVKTEPDGSFRMLIPGAQSVDISATAWNDEGGSEPSTATRPKGPGHGPSGGVDAGALGGPVAAESDAGSAAPSDAGIVTPPLDAATGAQPSGAAHLDAQIDAAQPDAQSRLATCEELDREAQRRIDALRAAAECGPTCQQIPTRTSCFSSCDIQVDSEMAASVRAALSLLEAQVCAPRAALSCAPLAERCDERGWPCVNDSCTLPDGPGITGVTRDQ